MGKKHRPRSLEDPEEPFMFQTYDMSYMDLFSDLNFSVSEIF